jgi:hypothetical protein
MSEAPELRLPRDLGAGAWAQATPGREHGIFSRQCVEVEEVVLGLEALDFEPVMASPAGAPDTPRTPTFMLTPQFLQVSRLAAKMR